MSTFCLKEMKSTAWQLTFWVKVSANWKYGKWSPIAMVHRATFGIRIVSVTAHHQHQLYCLWLTANRNRLMPDALATKINTHFWWRSFSFAEHFDLHAEPHCYVTQITKKKVQFRGNSLTWVLLPHPVDPSMTTVGYLAIFDRIFRFES